MSEQEKKAKLQQLLLEPDTNYSDILVLSSELAKFDNKPVFKKLINDSYFAKCCYKYAGVIVLPYYESLCNTLKDNKGVPNPLIPYLI